MNCHTVAVLALMLLAQRWSATVTGKVFDREHKPIAGAQISYKHLGSIDLGMASNSLGGASPKLEEGTGKVYKVTTDKKGEFTLIGVTFGVYDVEVSNSAGVHIYSGKKIVGDNNDPNISNTLLVDLSTVSPTGQIAAGAESNKASGTKGGKKGKNKSVLEQVRKENSTAAQINRLIADLQTALEIKDSRSAAAVLSQLIELDPNRWEFYQNLGTIQANQSQYQEAVETLTKGIAAAEKTLAVADAAKTRADIAGMLVYLGDAYNRLDKMDEALAAYNKAATFSPDPATPLFRACSALVNRSHEAAIEACGKAIAADPTQWQPYQTLAAVQNTAGNPNDALETFDKGIQAARKTLEAKPDSLREKNAIGQMLNAEGNIYAQQKQFDRAISAFTESATMSAYTALPYFNLCATYYNINRMEDAVAACNQAIASDSSMAEAYYIKASALFGKGGLEKGRYNPPPETRQTLTMYLAISPYGQHAANAREMLEKLDSEIDTVYKPAKPKKK